ncbi:hypothetical protein J4Q44_G00032490 [Coregonus suidteri]|uniref:Uncharacterized protein n=1 Tax=Coregonus suidteri TaxID=861788 RepID=A0AAN8R971_9TELE
MVISLLTGRALEGREGGECLPQLRQDGQTAAEYTLTFRTVPAFSGRNEPALRTSFRRGLHEEVQTELACRNDTLSLDALFTRSMRAEGRPRDHPSPGLGLLEQYFKDRHYLAPITGIPAATTDWGRYKANGLLKSC